MFHGQSSPDQSPQLVAIHARPKGGHKRGHDGRANLFARRATRSRANIKNHAFSITGMVDLARATCWSITINNPTEEDLSPTLPAKWAQCGQIEIGAEGTEHYQGMLTTPQVRFSAVKRVFPRAHIEVARNKQALLAYVQKEETRSELVPNRSSNIPTLFDYQHTIASRFDMVEFMEQCERQDKVPSEHVLDYIDELVAEDIVKGVCGIEYIAVNPMWRTAWKKFWRAMVQREKISTVDLEHAKISEKGEGERQGSPTGQRETNTSDNVSSFSQTYSSSVSAKENLFELSADI